MVFTTILLAVSVGRWCIFRIAILFGKRDSRSNPRWQVMKEKILYDVSMTTGYSGTHLGTSEKSMRTHLKSRNN